MNPLLLVSTAVAGFKNKNPKQVIVHTTPRVFKPGDQVFLIIGIEFEVTKPVNPSGYVECRFPKAKSKTRYLIYQFNLWTSAEYFEEEFRYDMVGNEVYIHSAGSKVRTYFLPQLADDVMLYVHSKGVDPVLWTYLVIYKRYLNQFNVTLESIANDELRRNHALNELDLVQIDLIVIPINYVYTVQ
jgi:hypothetical protein